MKYKVIDLKEGIKLHTIKTDKFKTNLVAVFLTTKLNRENVTKNALISMMLRRGSKNMPSQEEISKKMEEMYGASFDCGLDKTGDNQVLKFYIESINDSFLPKQGENNLKKSIENIIEIVFNPYIENERFRKEYIDQEKKNLTQKIQGKIDNKARYAMDRCIEEMYKGKPFGLFKFGYTEDLENINENNLYNYYKELINSCKIDIFVSGNVNDETIDIISKNEVMKCILPRNPNYVVTHLTRKDKKEEKIVTESMDVTQGKLLLGLDVNIDEEKLKYDVLIYNSILGGSANSKMFQNVRERAHLAYVASSSYLRHKNNIFINCGIEIANYEKALELIRKQIDDMKNGNFADKDIEDAKTGIIATVKTISDEQDTEISYYFGQELSQSKTPIEEYISKVKNVNKEDIINVADKISINTIYFLKD